MTTRIMILGALGLFAMQHMSAQSVEVFGGLKAGNMQPAKDYNSLTMGGWNTSVTFYPTYRFGITADVAGYYGTAQPASTVTVDGATVVTNQPEAGVRQYSFLAGPQIRLIRRGAVETSFKALFGAARGYLTDPSVPPPAGSPLTSGVYDETKFAALFGTNFDVRVSRKVALRFSPGLYLTQFGPSETQKSFTFSFGPVFRFGGSEN